LTTGSIERRLKEVGGCVPNERDAPFDHPTITEEMVADISQFARSMNFSARGFIADAVMAYAV
jgi:hypothetical protein